MSAPRANHQDRADPKLHQEPVVGASTSRGREPHRNIAWLATVSLLLAGTSLAIYALTAFTTPDWTVAGPGLLVAAAGVAGLKNRWFHLAGLVPMTAIATVAGPILAYDLARPDETTYFVGPVAIIFGGCLAAVFGTASAVLRHRRTLPLAVLSTALTIPLVVLYIVAGNPASAANDDITSAERAGAVDIEMIDFFFVANSDDLTAGSVVHLRNTGTLPHDFTLPALDTATFVPPGRNTYIRLPRAAPGNTEIVCTIGDHLQLGMRLTIAL